MVDTIFSNEYLIGRQITLTLLGWHPLKWKKCLTTWKGNTNFYLTFVVHFIL